MLNRANVAVVVCVTSLGAFLLGESIGRSQRSGGVGSAPELIGVDYGASVNTLVVILRKGCTLCEEIVPVLRRIRERRDATDPSVAIVYASRDNRSDFERFLEQHRLLPSPVVQLRPNQWPEVHSTPSALQVDSLGMVRRAWISMDSSVETDVLEHLGLTDEAIERKRKRVQVEAR